MSSLLCVAFEPGETAGCAAFARAIGLEWDLLSLSAPASIVGARRCLYAGLAELPPTDSLAAALAQSVKGYSHVAMASSMRAKDLLGRLAGLLDAAAVTDAIGVETPTRFTVPMLAGSVLGLVEAVAEPVLVTFRPPSFGLIVAEPGPSPEAIALDVPESRVRIVERVARRGARPDLTQAKVVVSGGRPLRDSATFESVIGGLADALGGAAGSTRAAVDAGIAPNELQVGQTGKVVAPDLYIAAGISGSTQHMAGMKDSKLIVAINTDGDAPIFEIADLGLVGDLYDVVPALRRQIEE